MIQNNIASVLKKHSVIPVVTITDLSEIDLTISTLLSKNINCVEVTLRTPVSFEAVKEIKNKYGHELSVGVGTIVSVENINRAAEIGVDFIVSPGMNKDLVMAMGDSTIPFIPGVATPSDIMLAMALDCQFLKFFPANLFGSVAALKTYQQVFPSIMFCPTGGLTESTYSQYLELTNVISVGGSWMLK
jgi:2-dehydro-3-deoxyphosphogluconate aldolase/(4S)-4-hydroxy-2-oxoglutarate aldolase